MTILLDGMSGLIYLPILILLWAAMPLSAIVALAFAYRGLRSGLDWGWIGLAVLVLAAPYVATVGVFGPGAFVLLLALDINDGSAFVALLNPVAAMLIVVAVLWRLPNRPRPVNGAVSRAVHPATRLTVDPGRARAAAVWFALVAGVLLALPAEQIDRRGVMSLLLFLAPSAAATAIVQRPVADGPPQESDQLR